jgi:hypothetical protein
MKNLYFKIYQFFGGCRFPVAPETCPRDFEQFYYKCNFNTLLTYLNITDASQTVPHVTDDIRNLQGAKMLN